MGCRTKDQSIRFRKQWQDMLPAEYKGNFHEGELQAWHDILVARVLDANAKDSRVTYPHQYHHNQCETELAIPVVQFLQKSHVAECLTTVSVPAESILFLAPHDVPP